MAGFFVMLAGFPKKERRRTMTAPFAVNVERAA
jgi:hypothetical protein